MAINTLRTGWNCRGGSVREQLAAQLRLARIQMEAALWCLDDEIGYDARVAWVKANTTDAMSCAEITALARAYLDDLVTCTCRTDDAGGLCPACKRTVAKLYTEELPY